MDITLAVYFGGLFLTAALLLGSVFAQGGFKESSLVVEFFSGDKITSNQLQWAVATFIMLWPICLCALGYQRVRNRNKPVR